MRTVDFSQVLFNALQFSGNDRHNIQPETFAQFRDFINYRLREIWESFPWTETTVLTNFTTTIENDVGYFTPASNADEILGVFNKNPLTTTRALDIDYKVWEDNGVEKIVVGKSSSEGFYLYRKSCPQLTGELYTAENSVYYRVGAQVYFDSGANEGRFMPKEGFPHSGNFYNCITQTNNGESPSTHPAKWQKIEIPYNFGTPLAWGSTANYFASEGMINEASAIEQKYELAREQEYDKATRQQGQITRMNMVKTY
jgi:hypothetical protein